MTRRRTRRIALTEIIGAAVSLFVVAPLAWMALDDDPAIRVVNYKVLANPVPRGGSLLVQYRAAFLRRCSGKGQRVFVDITNHVMSIDPFEFRDGIGSDGRPVRLGIEQEMTVSRSAVPYAAAPGPAHYQNITEFYCNPLQKALRGRWGMSVPFKYPVVSFEISPAFATRIEPPQSIFGAVHEDSSDASEILSDQAPPPPTAGDRR